MATTATTIEDLHPDILTRALGLLDGPALASASCVTTHLRSLSTQTDLWRRLCLSTWPSLSQSHLLHLVPSSYHSYFSDAYPFPSPRCKISDNIQLPTVLISAVDVYHKGVPIFSRVVETKTSLPWFQGLPFRMDALDCKDPLLTQKEASEISPADLTLSWVVLNPDTGRAVNVSSRRPVAVDRHWYTGDSLVKFAVVVEDRCSVSVVVTCGEEKGHVREVSLTVEDMDSICLNGRDSLEILQALIEGERRGKGREEAKERYEEYLRRKTERKETKAKVERRLDMLCITTGALLFLTFSMQFIFR